MTKVDYKGTIHLKSFSPEEILDLVEKYATPIVIGIDGKGYRVNLSSIKLRTFKDSVVCVDCGRVGTVMSLDTHGYFKRSRKAHFNLYCIESDGEYTLMTRDHIVPIFKGGISSMENSQTMCSICNSKKGSKLQEKFL